MRSLYSKLSLALLGIVLALGLALAVSARFAADRYLQETTQRLNAEIAAHIAAEGVLIDDGVVDEEALHSLAHFVMVINPTVELYLLDTRGQILGHAAPPDRVQRSQVELAPLRRFISGETALPLRGDDPRGSERQKIFSAAEVVDDGVVAGYVYAVLGGEKYDALASELSSSYVVKLGGWILMAYLAGAFLVGIVVFFLLTGRLRRLSRAMQQFVMSGYRASRNPVVAGEGNDELDQLGAAFDLMSRRIERQVTQLEETDRLRRELVSNVSHDLRTPLASMQGYIDTLLIKDRDLSGEERRKYLKIASDQGHRLQRLVDELFELAKLDSGSITPKMEPFSLPELIQDVGHEFEMRAARDQISLALLAEASDTIVRADIGLMQRVLENLLENALKHTPRGGTVEVRMQRGADRVDVTVADTGVGISDADLPHIFDRFYRQPTEQAPAGTGLGLAIVKRIVDLHGGRIEVDSGPQQGTRFTFGLPLAGAAG